MKSETDEQALSMPALDQSEALCPAGVGLAVSVVLC